VGGTVSRKPTPRRFSIHRGSPSLRRSAATWKSSVLPLPKKFGSHTVCRMRRRSTTAPGSSASRASSWYSLAVSRSGAPRMVASRTRGSIASGPSPVSGRVAVPARRPTARIRATSSRVLNGLAT
jgi:hypothetical protein